MASHLKTHQHVASRGEMGREAPESNNFHLFPRERLNCLPPEREPEVIMCLEARRAQGGRSPRMYFLMKHRCGLPEAAASDMFALHQTKLAPVHL
ncbi:unnamed protein product [Arctogadus glacialis]